MRIAERYVNTLYGGHVCQRWWADDLILVGGSIIDEADVQHLRCDLGVRAVLNVEVERSDSQKVMGIPLLELPTQDDGTPKPIEWWAAGIAFTAPLLWSGSCVYIHCQMGGSRSPAMVYGVLRAVLGCSPAQAIERIRFGGVPSYGDHPVHVSYLSSCEAALAVLKALRL